VSFCSEGRVAKQVEGVFEPIAYEVDVPSFSGIAVWSRREALHHIVNPKPGCLTRKRTAYLSHFKDPLRGVPCQYHRGAGLFMSVLQDDCLLFAVLALCVL
jgi:hypothetical protein